MEIEADFESEHRKSTYSTLPSSSLKVYTLNDRTLTHHSKVKSTLCESGDCLVVEFTFGDVSEAMRNEGHPLRKYVSESVLWALQQFFEFAKVSVPDHISEDDRIFVVVEGINRDRRSVHVDILFSHFEHFNPTELIKILAQLEELCRFTDCVQSELLEASSPAEYIVFSLMYLPLEDKYVVENPWKNLVVPFLDQSQTQPDILPPKSRIGRYGAGKNDWILWIERAGKVIIVPEFVLKELMSIRRTRDGWYIDPRLRPYVKLVTMLYGNGWLVEAIYNPDGTIFKEYDITEEMDAAMFYQDVLKTWNDAMLTVPKRAGIKIEKNIWKDTAEVRVLDTAGNAVCRVRVGWRGSRTTIYATYEPPYNLGSTIIKAVAGDTRIVEHGFVETRSGRLVSRRRVKESDVAKWLSELTDIVEDVIEKNRELIMKEVEKQYMSMKEHIEEARRRLGIAKPAYEPITADDIFKLTGVQP